MWGGVCPGAPHDLPGLQREPAGWRSCHPVPTAAGSLLGGGQGQLSAARLPSAYSSSSLGVWEGKGGEELKKTLLSGQHPPARLGWGLHPSPLPAGPVAAWRCNRRLLGMGTTTPWLGCPRKLGMGRCYGCLEGVCVGTVPEGSKLIHQREPARIIQHLGIPWDLRAP